MFPVFSAVEKLLSAFHTFLFSQKSLKYRQAPKRDTTKWKLLGIVVNTSLWSIETFLTTFEVLLLLNKWNTYICSRFLFEGIWDILTSIQSCNARTKRLYHFLGNHSILSFISTSPNKIVAKIQHHTEIMIVFIEKKERLPGYRILFDYLLPMKSGMYRYPWCIHTDGPDQWLHWSAQLAWLTIYQIQLASDCCNTQR